MSLPKLPHTNPIPDPYKLVPVSQYRIQTSIEHKKKSKGMKKEKINRNMDWDEFQLDSIIESNLEDLYITERSREESETDRRADHSPDNNHQNKENQENSHSNRHNRKNSHRSSNVSAFSEPYPFGENSSNIHKPPGNALKTSQNKDGNSYQPKVSKFQHTQITNPVAIPVPKKIKQSIEDARVSNFCFRKFMTIEYIAVLLTILSFFINLVYTEAADGRQLNLALYATTVLTFTLIGTIIARYYYFLELLKIQQVLRFSGNFFKKLYKSQYLFPMIIEIAIILIHPNVLFNDVELYELQAFTLFTIKHQSNDILALFVLLRIYIILRGMVSETAFSSPRASRLCRMNTCDHNLMFSIKCILKEYPLRALVVLFFLLLFVFGHGVKLTESPLSDVESPLSMDFTSYLNCFWCIIVTMGTIGYGDYYPRTIPGRIVIFLTSICGVLLSSLLIVALSAYLNQTTQQHKAHICIKRLELRCELDQEVSKVVRAVNKLGEAKKGAENRLDSQEQKKNLDGIITQLKQRIANVKNKQRQIKSLVDNNNLYEEMQRYFTILKTNFNEIYRRQINIKTFLLQIANISTTEELNVISFAKTLEEKALEK